MTLRTTLAALALVLAPGITSAMVCSDGHTEVTASSCKDGMIWDETKGTCVLTPSS
jgi:hypothetical protein